MGIVITDTECYKLEALWYSERPLTLIIINKNYEYVEKQAKTVLFSICLRILEYIFEKTFLKLTRGQNQKKRFQLIYFLV